jgi:type I restriction enzyme, S subunit
MTPYPHYKPSRIAWLGDIPEHWSFDRIKNIDSVNGRVGWKALKASEYIDSGFFFLSTPNIKNTDIDFINVNYITGERYFESPEIMLKKGDVLLVKDGSTLGIVNIVRYLPSAGTVNSSIAVLRFRKQINEYIYFWLSAEYTQHQIQLKKDGMGVPHLFQRDINNFLLLLPPLPEQAAIATYLDRKTQAIDKKIELLTQKITHYQHLRKTLINETVCRGLDKNVPLKDSGISWIGKIPQHWEVKRVKEIGKVVLGKMLNTTPQTGYYLKPYLKSKNIGWLQVNTDSVEEMYFNTAEMKQYRVKKGDLLLSEGGEVGKTCIWEGELPECYIQNSVHKVTVFKNHNSRFYLYLSFYLGTSKSYDSIVNQVSIKHLTWEKLNNIIWVVPPLPEQTAIAQYLDQQTQQIDHIVKNLQKQIELLRELRKTLINEVVTGKVRVVS